MRQNLARERDTGGFAAPGQELLAKLHQARVTLFRALAALTRAIEEPMRWIASNAGQEGSIVVQKVREMKDDEGFNALTDTYENLVKAGVIDPAKVVRSALQNASSIASLLLTTEALICEIPEEKKDAPQGGGPGGMGGMY